MLTERMSKQPSFQERILAPPYATPKASGAAIA